MYTTNKKINNQLSIWLIVMFWIISFMIFFLIHMFDITYFDGRISTLSWILLSGMMAIIKEKSLPENLT